MNKTKNKSKNRTKKQKTAPGRAVAYVPNNKRRCVVCNQTPTVDIKENGRITHNTDLCGPCCFGEAACIDPKEW